MAAEHTTAIESVRESGRAPAAPSGGGLKGRIERGRLFLVGVRNELKRVTWPSQKEVYATTIVVILTSVAVGLYLFAVDQALLAAVAWLFRSFGAGA
ncbi:MAG TPA: preprotein translocase subunit SecE [Vicinamibacterales bacterium]|jgi:preprotein translocase subunit SecE|nr:preprotein translocase subunit SecE [Vicinamibacterales bacterium]